MGDGGVAAGGGGLFAGGEGLMTGESNGSGWGMGPFLSGFKMVISGSSRRRRRGSGGLLPS